MSREEEYKKIFIQESGELLQQLNDNLLILEKDTSNVEALNAIFRSAHTLKSMAASMGYEKLSELSHRMEDVLSQIRSNEIMLNDQIVDLIFKSFDTLERMVDCVQGGKEYEGDIKQLLEAFDAVMAKGMVFEEEDISGVKLNVFEKNTLARVNKEGFSCYHVRIILDGSCVLKSVRAFMVFRNLHNIGEVIKSFPDSQALEEEKFDREFSCIFITREKKDAVKALVMDVLEIEKAAVEEMNVDALSEKGEEIDLSNIDAHASVEEELFKKSLHQMRRIQSVRVDITRMDKLMNLVEELAISKLKLIDIGARSPNADLQDVIDELSRFTDDLQTEVMAARLVPVGQVFNRFPRLVRDLSKSEGKKVRFEIIGEDIELDRTVLDEIGDPLIHLIKNSVDHGIETPEARAKAGKSKGAKVVLSAVREKGHVLIQVEDDGRGMDVNSITKQAIEKGIIDEADAKSMSNEELFVLATEPGFSTKKDVSEISGRGVGLDVVKSKSQDLGGSLIVESKKGIGTKISMRLPITTAVVQALVMNVGGKVFAIPISNILEIIEIGEDKIKKLENRETIIHRDAVLALLRCDDLFHKHMDFIDMPGKCNGNKNVIIVDADNNHVAIMVDRLIGQQDIVIKQLPRELKGIRGFAGATIMGDGSVALVLDVATLI